MCILQQMILTKKVLKRQKSNKMMIVNLIGLISMNQRTSESTSKTIPYCFIHQASGIDADVTKTSLKKRSRYLKARIALKSYMCRFLQIRLKVDWMRVESLWTSLNSS